MPMPLRITHGDNFIAFLDNRPEVAVCPVCRVPTHPFDHGFPRKKVPRQKWDLSGCVEGFTLATPRFKEFLEATCTSPVEFHITSGGYFILRPLWSVFEDFEPTYLNHGNFCACCGRHNSCHGKPVGVMAGQREIRPMDLVRTAVELGPSGHKSFSLIAGEGLAAAIKAQKFAGIHFLDYRDEFCAEAVLRNAGFLHKDRDYARSADMYDRFIAEYAIGVPKTADRAYLVAYAEHWRHRVGRKIGRRHFPEVLEADLRTLAEKADGFWSARFPAPSGDARGNGD